MARAAIVLRMLIASPSDVGKERDLMTQVIQEWNAVHSQRQKLVLEPIKWETHSYPAAGDRPQQVINEQIVRDADAVIGIFGCRLGTPTGRALSGTIEEIEELRKAGRHVALYFSDAPVPRDADRGQLEALENYRRDREKDTLYSTFSTIEDLRQAATRHLPQIVSSVLEKLRASREIGEIEQDLSRLEGRGHPSNPQIKSQFLGEYPDGPILWVTVDREVALTKLEYLDAGDAKLVEGDDVDLVGQDFRLRLDYSKLIRISNLIRSGDGLFRMKFRVDLTHNGASIAHVVPVVIEPSFKPINGTPTRFLRIAGSTTGYALS